MTLPYVYMTLQDDYMTLQDVKMTLQSHIFEGSQDTWMHGFLHVWSGLPPTTPPRRSSASRPPPRTTEAGAAAEDEAEGVTVVASAVEAEGDKAEDAAAIADPAKALTA